MRNTYPGTWEIANEIHQDIMKKYKYQRAPNSWYATSFLRFIELFVSANEQEKAEKYADEVMKSTRENKEISKEFKKYTVHYEDYIKELL